jgi:hypothetical protein
MDRSPQRTPHKPLMDPDGSLMDPEWIPNLSHYIEILHREGLLRNRNVDWFWAGWQY